MTAKHRQKFAIDIEMASYDPDPSALIASIREDLEKYYKIHSLKAIGGNLDGIILDIVEADDYSATIRIAEDALRDSGGI